MKDACGNEQAGNPTEMNTLLNLWEVKAMRKMLPIIVVLLFFAALSGCQKIEVGKSEPASDSVVKDQADQPDQSAPQEEKLSSKKEQPWVIIEDGDSSPPAGRTRSGGVEGPGSGSGIEIGEKRIASMGALGISRGSGEFNTEAYDHIESNDFHLVKDSPLSTFSIDVDTASYANVRRFLKNGQLPPKGAVRIEELINYFTYDYAQPDEGQPFSVNVETAACPWNEQHELVRIGLQGKAVKQENRPAANLVFLLDVSGSMNSPNKLPLLKNAFQMLVKQLNAQDRVAIVVYAGASGLVLPSTTCDRRQEILDALSRLEAGGSTNGGAGIQLAYQIAQENRIEGGINRVILATDGDFNVGVTNQGELIELITEKAKSGVFLSVLGFGMGNFKDSTLEKLADKGNGNYGYIDTFSEARKVFSEQLSGTLFTIAKDVKIQIEFNPAQVQAYRLIGYENRILADRDLNDDKKDAGEIGAGHTVTALYQIVPIGVEIGDDRPPVDELIYQQAPVPAENAPSDELLTVKLRYKEPDGETSKLLQVPVRVAERSLAEALRDLRWAAAVAAFGMALRDEKDKGAADYDLALKLAQNAQGNDEFGYRREFIDLVRSAQVLK